MQSYCYSYCPQQISGIYYYTSITKTCNQCNSPCNACIDATSCTSCLTGFYLVENLTSNNCVQACPSGYYFVDSICKRCNSLCTLCSDNPDNCKKCIESAFSLSPNQCISACPLRYVANESGECVTCKSLNKYFYIDRCVDSCPKSIEDPINKLCNDSVITLSHVIKILVIAGVNVIYNLTSLTAHVILAMWGPHVNIQRSHLM
jgi:hypothetical protein